MRGGEGQGGDWWMRMEESARQPLLEFLTEIHYYLPQCAHNRCGRTESKLYSLGFSFWYKNVHSHTRRWRMRAQDQPNGAFILLLRLLFALLLPEYICSNNKKWLFCSLLFYRSCLQRAVGFSPLLRAVCHHQCLFAVISERWRCFHSFSLAELRVFCCSFLHRCSPLGP